MTGFMSAYREDIPQAARFANFGPVSAETEAMLVPCACGGKFRRDASPRCPMCKSKLSAEQATWWLERDAPGTAAGWRWQRSWAGLYALVIEHRSMDLRWAKPTRPEPRNESG